ECSTSTNSSPNHRRASKEWQVVDAASCRIAVVAGSQPGTRTHAKEQSRKVEGASVSLAAALKLRVEARCCCGVPPWRDSLGHLWVESGILKTGKLPAVMLDLRLPCVMFLSSIFLSDLTSVHAHFAFLPFPFHRCRPFGVPFFARGACSSGRSSHSLSR